MDNSINENKFLEEIRNTKAVNKINKCDDDILKILRNLIYLEKLDKKGGPDYAYKQYYFEKFSIDSYERKYNKNKKCFSMGKVIKNKVDRKSRYKSNIFGTLTFSDEDIRSNIRYMRKNLIDMIEQKLLRLDTYKMNYSIGKIFGLIIEVEDFCQVYTNDKGEYFSRIVDTNGLRLEKYEIYKDYNLVKKIQEICDRKVDILIFKENISFGNILINCIDIRNKIIKSEMIVYPNKIFQICKGSPIIVSTRKIENTNIQYKSNKHLESKYEKINIDGIELYKSSEPNVYSDSRKKFFFETTQNMIALNPNITVEEFLVYFSTIIKEELIIKDIDEIVKLKRQTPMQSYIHLSLRNGNGVYRVNTNRKLYFKFSEIS